MGLIALVFVVACSQVIFVFSFVSLVAWVVDFGFMVLVAHVVDHVNFLMSCGMSKDCCPYTCVLLGCFLWFFGNLGG